ncbi:MAG TPA: DUF4383 domain-containing protein [Nocardioidaceae bacterium]|nr:DUF4383 domain-containing protein [Nocardioidaceae bacterium]
MHRFSRSPASIFALLFGLAYLAAGLAGFAATGLHGFASMDGPRLLGLFMVNPLHNVVHLTIAAVWLLAASRHTAARIANLALGTTLGLVTVLGFGHVLMFLGIHSLGDPDNFLHLVSATLALYFGSIGADRLVTEPVPRTGLGV